MKKILTLCAAALMIASAAPSVSAAAYIGNVNSMIFHCVSDVFVSEDRGHILPDEPRAVLPFEDAHTAELFTLKNLCFVHCSTFLYSCKNFFSFNKRINSFFVPKKIYFCGIPYISGIF